MSSSRALKPRITTRIQEEMCIAFSSTATVITSDRIMVHVNPVFSPNRFTCMVFLLLSKGCIPGPHDFASVSGLASHSGCLGPHEFTLVSHLSPTLVCHSGCLGPHEFTVYTCLPHSSPTLVCHTCLVVWVPWAA